jgi:hypothetical protein
MMLFHIKWPDGSMEDCASECETREGFINERFGEHVAFEAFLERGGILESDEEVQEQFKVFQAKLNEQEEPRVPKLIANLEELERAVARGRGEEKQEITKSDVLDLNALLGGAVGAQGEQ